MADAISPSSMLAIGSVLPALSIIAVCARFYIRVRYKQGLGADDWLIIPALFLVIGMGICIIIGQQQQLIGYTFGSMPLDFLNDAIVFVEQIEYAFMLMGILSLGFTKLSILYFYRRVFVTGHKTRLNIFTKVLAGIIVAWNFSMAMSSILFCGTNVAENWASFSDQTATCANAEAINLFLFSTDVLLDLILLVLPIPLVARLQISKSRRIGVIFIFCIGSLAVISSILRLVIFGLVYSGNGYNFVGQDLLIAVAMLFYWSTFETSLAIIAACLPSLQILFRKLSMDQIAKNVRGIFSVQSLNRSYGQSQDRADGAKSSRSNSQDNDTTFIELSMK